MASVSRPVVLHNAIGAGSEVLYRSSTQLGDSLVSPELMGKYSWILTPNKASRTMSKGATNRQLDGYSVPMMPPVMQPRLFDRLGLI
jgi:hypothetical protein